MELLLLELTELASDFDAVWGVELVMLCVLMTVGLYVSYTDVRYREIPPASVWTLLACGVAGRLVLWHLGSTDLLQICVQITVVFAASYLLFAYGFWAAGDAKLYWAIAVAFPPTLAVSPDIRALGAPAWALLVNAVVLSFAFLLVWLAVGERGQGKDAPDRLHVRDGLLLGRDAAAATGYVAGGGLLSLHQALSFGNAVIAATVAVLAMRWLVREQYRVAVSVPGIGLVVYASLAPGSLGAVSAAFATTWGILGVHSLIRARFGNALVQSLAVDALQPGMVPAVSVCASGNAGKGGNGLELTQKVGRNRHVLCRAGVPLSVEGVSRLRAVAERRTASASEAVVPVQSPVPFAPFLVLSTAATAILGGHVGTLFMQVAARVMG